MSKLSRFLMLERSRRGEGDAAGDPRPASPVADRFAGVDARGAEPAPPPADPFAPPPEPTAAVDVTAADEDRPSTRCLGCATENGRFAAACGSCGAPLGTREVIRFNRRLWQEERPQVDEARRSRRDSLAAEVDAMAELKRADKAVAVDTAFRKILRQHGERERGPDPWWWKGLQIAIVVVIVVAIGFVLRFIEMTNRLR